MKHLLEPARRVPIAGEADVLVVGGGSAGLAAAVSAARHGAKTVLLERYGSLGGMATGGLITLLLTLDDGRGNPVVGGICQEIVDRLASYGAARRPALSELGGDDPARVEYYRQWGLVWGRPPHTIRYSVAFDPEYLRHVANDMLLAANVRIRLHTWAVDVVIDDGIVRAVVSESKGGREAWRAKMVIDASGDGDMFAAAGESFELEPIHPWLWFRMGNVRDPESAIQRAEGRFFPTLGGRFFKAIGKNRTLMPWGIADVVGRKIDPTSPDDLTFAEIECRREVMKVVERLRAEVTGFEDAYLDDLAWQLGIYESRRLSGVYTLRRDDQGIAFDDAIALTGDWVQPGDLYWIPYRCLLPRSVDNLLVAGRCISVDHRVHQATKEIPPCIATGEAAGAAAALAASSGIAPRSLDGAVLRAALLRAGVLLAPQRQVGGGQTPHARQEDVSARFD